MNNGSIPQATYNFLFFFHCRSILYRFQVINTFTKTRWGHMTIATPILAIIYHELASACRLPNLDCVASHTIQR